MAIKEYANEKNISIVGDAPIFLAWDSADVWSHQELFMLDSKGYPTEVAGVPPDYFSETGQLWGNPLYNWSKHTATGYEWWIERIKYQLTLTDFLRIDHFRGFDRYWAVPYGEETAINGENGSPLPVSTSSHSYKQILAMTFRSSLRIWVRLTILLSNCVTNSICRA